MPAKKVVSYKHMEAELRKHPLWVAVLATLRRDADRYLYSDEVAAEVRGFDEMECVEAEVRAMVPELKALGLDIHCSPSQGRMYWNWRQEEYEIVNRLFTEIVAKRSLQCSRSKQLL